MRTDENFQVRKVLILKFRDVSGDYKGYKNLMISRMYVDHFFISKVAKLKLQRGFFCR